MSRKDEVKFLSDLWHGFWASRVLLTANNLGIFSRLGTPVPAAEVAVTLGTDPRATELLLNALAGLGLVTKKGNRYANAPLARRLLVPGSPSYMGDILRHADTLWQNWSGLDEVVRSGRPNRVGRNHGSFIRGMHNIASQKADSLLRAIGLTGVKSALDLGGGPATYTMAMARHGVRATLFDLPDTIKVAREVVRETAGPDILFREGDMLTDEFGEGYDLILISQVFHSFGPDQCLAVLQKCRAALNPGGRVVIQEFRIDKSLAAPAPGTLFAVNMLVNTERGRCYSPDEMSDWLKKSGFGAIKVQSLDETVLVSGAAGARSRQRR